MFQYNGGNCPESKTTRIFRPVRQVAVLGRSLLSPTASCCECLSHWCHFITQVLFLGPSPFFSGCRRGRNSPGDHYVGTPRYIISSCPRRRRSCGYGFYRCLFSFQTISQTDAAKIIKLNTNVLR